MDGATWLVSPTTDLTPVIAEFAQLHLSDWTVNPVVPGDHPQRVGQYKPTVKRWVNTVPGEKCGKRLGTEVVHLLNQNPDLCPIGCGLSCQSQRRS